MNTRRTSAMQGVLAALILILSLCQAGHPNAARRAVVPTVALAASLPGPTPTRHPLASTVALPLPLPNLTPSRTRITPRPTQAPKLTAAPTPTPTATPTRAPSPTPSPLPTPTPSPTPIPWTARQVMGYSVQGRAIEVVRFGLGPRWFVVAGAIHGGSECNTGALVERLAERISEEPALLSADVTLYLVPVLNPDGCAQETRFNDQGVDLNRNWDTGDWTSAAQWSQGTVPGSGGPHPFSEPETTAMRDWLLALRSRPHQGVIHAIFYHSAVPLTGLALPGADRGGQPGRASDALARAYAGATGYRYSPAWVGGYTTTGEAINWANDRGLAAIDVELPDRGGPDTVPEGWPESHFETNLRGLLSVMASSTAPTLKPTR